MANFKGTITDSESNTYNVDVSVPDFALESTLKKIEDILSKSTKLNSDTKESIEKLVKETKSGNEKKETDNLVKKMEKFFKENQSGNKTLRERVSANVLDNMEKDFRRVGNAVTTLTTVMITAGAVASTFLVKGFTNLGEGLKTLTDVGGAFGDSLSQTSISAEQNILSMNKLGLTTGQAVEVLGNYSRTMAVLGQSSVVGATKSFLDLSDGGLAFGSTLQDATEFLQEDLMFRTMMLRRDQINNEQAIRDSLALNQNLRMFSTLLGINSDELKKNAQNVIDGNTAFKAYAASLQNGQSVITGAEMLATGLFGSLGDAGQQVANGLLTISATGVGAIDDFVNELVPLAPGVARVVEDVAKGLRSGRIDQSNANQAVLRITEAFANVDPSTINQLIPIISGLGGELAGTSEVLVQGFINAGNSVDKLRQQLDMPLAFSDTQSGLITFQNIVSKAQGALSGFQNALVIGASQGLNGFSKLLDSAIQNEEFAEMLTNAGRRFGTIFNNVISRMGGMDAAIAKISDGIGYLLEEGAQLFENILNGFVDKQGNLQIFQGFVNMVADGLIAALKLGFKIIGEAFMVAITNPTVIGSIVLGFATLFAASSLLRAVQGILIAGFTKILAGIGARLGLTSLATTVTTTALTTAGTTAAGVTASGAAANKLLNKDGTPDKKPKANKTTTKGVLKGATRVAGKFLLPVTAALGLYDAIQGFGADQNASVTGKMANAGSSLLNGLTFGLLGSSSKEIAERSQGKEVESNTALDNNVALREAVMNVTAKSMTIHITDPTIVRLVNPVMNTTNRLNATQRNNTAPIDVVTTTQREIDTATNIQNSGIDPKNYTPEEKELVDKVNNLSDQQTSVLQLMLSESKKQTKHLADLLNKDFND
jgi:hypothetical protein